MERVVLLKLVLAICAISFLELPVILCTIISLFKGVEYGKYVAKAKYDGNITFYVNYSPIKLVYRLFSSGSTKR
jgi:hydrogenase/urease accessory protein HupE